jgi:hypothetical protein
MWASRHLWQGIELKIDGGRVPDPYWPDDVAELLEGAGGTVTGTEWVVVGACAAWLDAAALSMKAPMPTAAAKIRSIPILLGRMFTGAKQGSGLFMSSALNV